jgi:hypothetical protein
MAWLVGWSYRKSHIINYAAGAGTLYQKQITVHYGAGEDTNDDVYCTVGGVAHCKTDFSDIRFTDDGGSTELDYWMESKVDSNNAVFWVEVSGDLSTVAKTIYVYYGKADATTTSNGDNTFLVYDHFLGVSLNTDKWNAWYETNVGSYAVSDSILTVLGPSPSGWSHICSKSMFGTATAFRFYGKFDETSLADFGGDDRSADPPHPVGAGLDYMAIRTNSTSDIYLTFREGSSGSSSRTSNLGSYTILEMRRTGTTVEFLESDVSKVTRTTQIPTDNLGIFIAVANVKYIYCDWCLVRKYVSPEPTHGAWGNEEVPIQNYSRTITEYIGNLDTRTRLKSIYRIFTDKLAGLDSKLKAISRYRIKTELLGMLDTKSKFKSISITFTDIIGEVDSNLKNKNVTVEVTELLGNLDSKSKYKGVNKVINDIIGALDSIIHTPTWYLNGVTRDSIGNPLGSCDVYLFYADTKEYIGTVVSEVDGSYRIEIPELNINYFIYARKSNGTVVTGASDMTLTRS